MAEQVPPGEQMRRYCQVAGAEAYCVATRTACYVWLKQCIGLCRVQCKSGIKSVLGTIHVFKQVIIYCTYQTHINATSKAQK